jgi:hypothetical protein
MWLMTKYGFYSIVQKKPGEFHVRAQVRADLDALKGAVDLEAEVNTSKSTDYRYRMVVDKAAVCKVMAVLDESIDYDNFKSHIAATPTQRAKLHAYYNIWEAMFHLQDRKAD